MRRARVGSPTSSVSLTVASCLVAVTSVPFGLAVGELAPHELEGVLILIGVVGVLLGLAAYIAYRRAAARHLELPPDDT